MTHERNIYRDLPGLKIAIKHGQIQPKLARADVENEIETGGAGRELKMLRAPPGGALKQWFAS
jgi:hypothetical protein